MLRLVLRSSVWRGLLLSAFACAAAACDDGAADPAPIDAERSDTLDLDAGPDDAGATDAEATFDGRPLTDALAPDGPYDEVRALYATVNDLPESLRGLLPGTFEGNTRQFYWVVPLEGWTIDVHVVHPGGWTPPATDPYLLLRAISLQAEPKVLDAATVDVVGWRRSAHGHTWTARVAADISAGPGRYTIQTAVDGEVGEAVTFDIRERPADTHPFPETEHWLLTTDRDNSGLTVAATDGGFSVTTTAGPNDVPDLNEALAAMGLLSEDATWNAALLERVREELRERITGFYDGVNVVFHVDTDPDLPDPEDRASWSQIAIGGADARFVAGERAFFGRAEIDFLNRRPNDDTQPELGIFTVNFVRFVFANPVTKVLAADFAPAAGGQPFGSRPGDLRFLEPDFDPASVPEAERARAGRFGLVLEYLMLALASVTAHEIGHSVGLVKPGFPPNGLLAGVEGPWVVAPIDGAHIDTAGFNLMQSGTNFALGDAIRGAPRFNAPNLAYLRGQIIVLP